ncbi:MAG: hypothetical protein RL374_231 [Actinomycetota bacterium]|jgi:hypothetical protein
MATNSKSISFSRRSAGALLLVGVLAGVTVGGGVGVIAASTSKSVTVCVDKIDKHLNYSKSGVCKPHQTKLVLNQTGAAGGIAGAKGDTGAAGAAGAKGADGTAGTNGTNGTNGAGVVITQQSVCDGTDVDTVANEVCKIGMTGPGGGHIFLVDYYDQYAGFDYLEAAPAACEQAATTWSAVNTAVAAAGGWAARAVGAGQANTTAILAVFTTATTLNNAAKYADSLTCGTQTDWFLGSYGDMRLMREILQGIGNFTGQYYWTSSEYTNTAAFPISFNQLEQLSEQKNFGSFNVRPVRDF